MQYAELSELMTTPSMGGRKSRQSRRGGQKRRTQRRTQQRQGGQKRRTQRQGGRKPVKRVKRKVAGSRRK